MSQNNLSNQTHAFSRSRCSVEFSHSLAVQGEALNRRVGRGELPATRRAYRDNRGRPAWYSGTVCWALDSLRVFPYLVGPPLFTRLRKRLFFSENKFSCRKLSETRWLGEPDSPGRIAYRAKVEKIFSIQD